MIDGQMNTGNSLEIMIKVMEICINSLKKKN